MGLSSFSVFLIGRKFRNQFIASVDIFHLIFLSFPCSQAFYLYALPISCREGCAKCSLVVFRNFSLSFVRYLVL